MWLPTFKLVGLSAQTKYVRSHYGLGKDVWLFAVSESHGMATTVACQHFCLLRVLTPQTVWRGASGLDSAILD